MTGVKKLTERSSERKCIFLDRKQVIFKLRLLENENVLEVIVI